MKARARFHNRLVALLLALSLAAPAGAVDQTQIDTLFDSLSTARDEAAAGRIAAEIRIEWEKSGSAAIDFLYRRGMDALDAGDTVAAVEHFTAAIDHDPDFTAAFEGRARAYHLAGKEGPALADLARVLSAEPRQFDAMAELATILEEIGQNGRARDAWQQALAINPATPGAREAIARLSQALDGQGI